MKPDVTTGDWADWRTWPKFTLATDHGPECVTVSRFFKAIGMNFVAFFDFAHGSKLDWKGMLEDVDMFAFWLIYLVAQNAASGPLSDATRWKALLEAWRDLFGNYTTSNPLFQACVQLMIRNAGGEDKFNSEVTVEEAVFQDCIDNPPVPGPRPKVNLNRFWDSHQRARLDIREWGKLELNFTHLALEEGLLASRSLVKVMVPPKAAENDETARDTTSTSKAHYDDKYVRGMPRQAVIAGVHVFGERIHEQFVHILTEAANPTEAWFRHQSHFCRDVESNSRWLSDQVSGGYLQHVVETLLQPSRRQVLLDCGIDCPSKFTLDPGDTESLYILKQDDLAALLGDATMSMASRRLCRCLWATRGWPVRLIGLITDKKQPILDDFKNDYEAYSFVSAMDDKTTAVTDRLRRSVFLDVAVQQYVEAFISTSTTYYLPHDIFAGKLCNNISYIGLKRSSIFAAGFLNKTHKTQTF
jgi:hypothetical protein